MIVRLSAAPAEGLALAAFSVSDAALAAPTVTARPVPLLSAPSVTVMLTDSTL